jgi:outer membrane protein
MTQFSILAPAIPVFLAITGLCFAQADNIPMAEIPPSERGIPIAEKQILDVGLGEAIQRALSLNFQIKVEEFTPRIAEAREFRESGRFDPTLLLSYTYDERRQELRTLTDDLNVSGEGAQPDLFALTSGSEVDSSIAGLLPWGLNYDIGASITANDDTRQSFTRYTSFTGLNIVQPLLRNFGTNVNLAPIRIARTNVAISAWQLRQRVIDVVTETVLSYNDLYFANLNLGVELRSRSLAAQLLRDNQKRAEIGVMAPLDIVQAQADLATREERVLVAQRLVADTENTLKGLITDEVRDILGIRLRIEPPPSALGFRPDLEKDFAAAFDLRPDYRQALLEIQRRNISLVFNRNQILPRLDVVASLGVNGIDRSWQGSIENIGSRGQDNLAWQAGAVFSMPIPNRTARGELAVNELEIAQAIVNLKRLEQSILLEADTAAGQIETTRQRIEASGMARKFAQLTLEAGQTRLASGTTTTFEVLQFQRDLAQAEINEIRAVTDHNKAIAEYARRTGTTLLFNRIDFEEPPVLGQRNTP